VLLVVVLQLLLALLQQGLQARLLDHQVVHGLLLVVELVCVLSTTL
jgi:hypothetical protein